MALQRRLVWEQEEVLLVPILNLILEVELIVGVEARVLGNQVDCYWVPGRWILLCCLWYQMCYPILLRHKKVCELLWTDLLDKMDWAMRKRL